jgi:hypothetical protein
VPDGNLGAKYGACSSARHKVSAESPAELFLLGVGKPMGLFWLMGFVRSTLGAAGRISRGQSPGLGLGPGQTSGRGMEGSVRREVSTTRPERMRAWMSSLTSQTLTFMPATTTPPDSQNAMNSSASRSPRYTTWS